MRGSMRVRQELGMEGFEQIETSIRAQLAHIRDERGRVSLQSIINMTREPAEPQRLCTVRYTPEGGVVLRAANTACHRDYGEMRINPTAATSASFLLENPGELTKECPPEGLAMFVHGGELVLDSMIKYASTEKPVTVAMATTALQWLFNKCFEYTMAWIDRFCKRNGI